MKLSVASLLLLLLCLYCSEASALVRVPIQRAREPHPLTHFQRLRRLSTADEGTNIHLTFSQMSYYAYYSYVSFGTPPQTFKTIFDIASNVSWVYSTDCDCQDWGCDVYNHSESSTYVPDGRNVSIETFITVHFEGYLSQDTVRVGSLAVKKQIFLEQVLDNTPIFTMNAAIGLGYPAVTMQNVSGILYAMFKEGLVEQPVFGFYFKKPKILINASGAYGELTLGGSDPNHFVGQLSYAPVDSEGFWQVKMDGVKIGKETFDDCSVGCEVIMLTSFPFYVVPNGDMLNLRLGALPIGEATWVFKCSDFRSGSLPNVTLTINGKGYILSPEDYAIEVDSVCSSLIYDGLIAGPFKDKWLLGNVFMAKYYTEFDAANKRIGFALAKHD